MKKVLIAVIALSMMSLAGCSQNSKKSGTTGGDFHQNSIPMQDIRFSSESEEVDPALAALYDGVKLQIMEVQAQKAYEVIVPFNTPFILEGTPLVLEVTQFYPDFVMSDNGYGTRSDEPNNIAAKVRITGEAPEFDGWLFAGFPGVHPYENPNYSVVLTGAVKK